MKPPYFIYHDPVTLEEATELYSNLDNAVLLAGGQSLMPMMNFRVANPDHVIDLNRIAPLSYIQCGSNVARFGAMTRQRDLEFSPDVARTLPIVREALKHVGHRQTRNRGTFGGSLCHLDPSAELLNMTVLHDGTLTVARKDGTREIAAADWVDGIMTNALEPGEMLSAVALPLWPQGHGFAFEEFARRHGDFAIAAVSCLVTLDNAGAIARAAICVSGLGPGPVRMTAAEQALVGRNPGHETFRAAAAESEKLDAMSDIYVSGDYRQHLARILTYRALERATRRGAERLAA